MGWVKSFLILFLIIGVFVSISIYLESSVMPSSIQRAHNKLKDAEAFEASRMRSPVKEKT